MKKIAIVVDFDPKFLKEKEISSKFDLFILDRLNDNIANVETRDENEFKNAFLNEMTIEQFYKTIATSYKEVFCLFLSYDYSNIDDYLITEKINKNREANEAKIYTYLLNYMIQNKQMIFTNTIEMIEKDFDIKDIIVRVHNIRKKEAFSLNDIIMRYVSCIF